MGCMDRGGAPGIGRQREAFVISEIFAVVPDQRFVFVPRRLLSLVSSSVYGALLKTQSGRWRS